MFYSHNFLARKGPLGTVWCAAHLQHNLTKSHYITTHVPSTVDRIMSPEVPIALRMSGHLLLGVVRIYSKKLDYLYEDCIELRITINKVFKPVNLNLPLDATHAPPDSITLLEKVNLDALDLDYYYADLGEDYHSRSSDEISLTDQIPTGEDPYVIISYNEQDLRASSVTEEDSETGPTPMDDDVLSTAELNTPARLEDPSSSNQMGPHNRNARSSSSPNLPSVEIMRDAAHGFDFNNSSILPNRAAPDRFLEEQINLDKEDLTPSMEEIMSSGGHVSSPHGHEEQQSSLGLLNSPTSFDHRSPEMEIQQSPHAAEHPRVQRRRKCFFDESTVLSNRYMENLLNETSNICRKRRNYPLSSLNVWKVNKRLRLRKEDVIFEPLINGVCADLQAIYKEDLIKSSKFELSPNQETHQETSVAQPPMDGDMEIDVLLNNEHASPEREICTPFINKDVPSPVGRDIVIPENSNLNLQSERVETTGGSDGLLSTSDAGPSGNLDSGSETPDTFFDRCLQDEH